MEPEPLEVEELITVFLQKELMVLMLTSRYKEGEKEDMWSYQNTSIGCPRINE